MIHYEKTNFESHGETYKYRLTENTLFVSQYNLGRWSLYTPDGNIVADCNGNIVNIYKGYMWDGSTVVGSVYEDDITLEASLIHDVLYNANKNPDDLKVNFSLFEADIIFRNHLIDLYSKSGNWFQKYIFPNLYLVGLWILGLPWKFGNNDFYNLKLNN